MANMNLAPHEAIELREFIDQEIVSMKKTNANLQMVKDQDLKNFMQDSLNTKKTALKEIFIQIGGQLNQQKGCQ